MRQSSTFFSPRLKLSLFRWLKKRHWLPDNVMLTQDLNFIRGVEKQLDEYRELLENIEAATGYFSSPQGEFSGCHAVTLDDYLSHLYFLRYGIKPSPETPDNYLRQKPQFIQFQTK